MKEWLTNRADLAKKLIWNLLLSSSWALIIAVFFTGHLWQLNNIRQNLASLRIWVSLNRAFLLFFVLFFIGLHFILPVKKMYDQIFEKRWLVGMLLLLFLTVNRYHGDSITYYNETIQPEAWEDDASVPIFGKTRAIRSDEYIVDTPSALAAGYGEHPYGARNEVMRGTETSNIAAGVYVGYMTLAKAPWELSYKLLPREYAFSFCWYAKIILGFLMSIELFCLITKKNRLLSVTGAFLIVFSSFYMWWRFSIHFISAPGTIVCVHYFLNSDKFWKRILLGLGTALCFGNFILNLYPAWQVPLGYMFLAIGIWCLHENWEKVKKLKLRDWMVIAGALGLVASFVLSYFIVASEYVEVINATVYPGKRVNAGGFKLHKLFYYAQAPFYAYQDVGNASEAGVYFNLFPIPTLMAAYCFLREKKKDWLTGGLLLVQIPMLIYVTVGFPEMIAKLLLFSHSTPKRLVDVVGLMQVYLIVILLSHYRDAVKLPKTAAGFIGAVTAGFAIWVSSYNYPDYMSLIQKAVMFVVIAVSAVCLMISLRRRTQILFLAGLIAVSLFTGSYVRPVIKGFDAIYAKPVAGEIQKIAADDKEGKWITQGVVGLSAYTVACGAPTVNSCNVYPNLELWESLDPEHKYSNIYNRYAHVDVEFTSQKTSFELVWGDHIKVNLSYKDIEKTGAAYLLCQGELKPAANKYVQFDKVYEENGMTIYHILYE